MLVLKPGENQQSHARIMTTSSDIEIVALFLSETQDTNINDKNNGKIFNTNSIFIENLLSIIFTKGFLCSFRDCVDHP